VSCIPDIGSITRRTNYDEEYMGLIVDNRATEQVSGALSTAWVDVPQIQTPSSYLNSESVRQAPRLDFDPPVRQISG
jgi:hypothetical protein